RRRLDRRAVQRQRLRRRARQGQLLRPGEQLPAGHCLGVRLHERAVVVVGEVAQVPVELVLGEEPGGVGFLALLGGHLLFARRRRPARLEAVALGEALGQLPHAILGGRRGEQQVVLPSVALPCLFGPLPGVLRPLHAPAHLHLPARQVFRLLEPVADVPGLLVVPPLLLQPLGHVPPALGGVVAEDQRRHVARRALAGAVLDRLARAGQLAGGRQRLLRVAEPGVRRGVGIAVVPQGRIRRQGVGVERPLVGRRQDREPLARRQQLVGLVR